MLAEALAQAQARNPVQAPAAPAPTQNVWLDLQKRYAQVDKLSGQEDWREWHFRFLVATRAFAPTIVKLLEAVQALDLSEADTTSVEGGVQPGDVAQLRQSSGEIFNVLILWTKGEANQLVRSVDDSNGYVAWKRLYDRYNPRTPASLTAAWRDVVRPKKVRDLREIGKALDAWEGKVYLLRREHGPGEEPTPGLKAALLLEMLPESVQMTVAQGIPAGKLDYDALKAKVKMMASVQMDLSTPKPMDVGELQAEYGGGWEQDAGAWEEVEAVGKGKGRGPMFGSCWVCGGPHFAHECPQNGKGAKGGKGGTKGAGRGESANKGKGKGKTRAPMFGSCWTCGGAHFQADCPQGEQKGAQNKGGGKSKGKGKFVREVDENHEEEEQHEVDSVYECWNIFGLDAFPVLKKERRPGRWVRKEPSKIEVKNRFAELMDIDQVEEETGENDVTTGQNCHKREYSAAGESCHVGENCRMGEDGDWIQAVAEDARGLAATQGEIVIDSGAAESVCPWNWAETFPVKEVPWGEKRQFRNASGGKMEHYGERRVRCSVKGMEAPVSMLFQVSDAKNPLASVARITEKGNIVQFGPEEGDNYIFNPDTEEKVMLRRKGRKFVLDVNFLADGGVSLFSGRA